MDFLALDVETANADLASICQIGLATFRNGKVVDEFSTLVNPEDYFDPINISVHGITERDVAEAPSFDQVHVELSKRLSGAICATHTHFDRSAMQQVCAKHNLEHPACTWLDTARVARRTWESVAKKGYGLANLASMLEIEFLHHDALEDAKAAGMILCAAVNESGLTVQDWISRVDQPISGHYREAIKHEGNPAGPLFGEVVVFTGALEIPRREAAQMAADLGCAVKTGVSKTVTILVVGDQDVTKFGGHNRSSKHRKAIELITQGYPIRILRESDFRALIDSR